MLPTRKAPSGGIGVFLVMSSRPVAPRQVPLPGIVTAAAMPQQALPTAPSSSAFWNAAARTGSKLLPPSLAAGWLAHPASAAATRNAPNERMAVEGTIGRAMLRWRRARRARGRDAGD